MNCKDHEPPAGANQSLVLWARILYLLKAVKPVDIFKCEQCGDCCKGYGGTFVTEEEIISIADYLGADPKCFVKDYCRISGGKPVLAQGNDVYCIFWNGLCAIHPAKPRMCRAWPFIESVLIDVGNWQIMAASCPGIHTDVPDSVIKECVGQAVANFRL